MSHFSVLVIGPDPERQLAPYHEFECTGRDDEFVQDVDITAKVQEKIDELGPVDGLGWFGLEGKAVTSELFVDRSNGHKYGYAVVRDDKLIKAVDRTNPNKRWDWYSLGGRYSGRLQKRDGTRVDAALVREVDFDGIRARYEAEARERYRKFMRMIGDAPFPKTWEAMRAKFPGNLESALTAYDDQPAIQRIKDDDDFRWSDDVAEEFRGTEDQHAERARQRAVTTFAVVKDGQWYENGKMGWFGCVFDEKDEDLWFAEVAKLLDGLGPDTPLAVYDCHI